MPTQARRANEGRLIAVGGGGCKVPGPGGAGWPLRRPVAIPIRRGAAGFGEVPEWSIGTVSKCAKDCPCPSREVVLGGGFCGFAPAKNPAAAIAYRPVSGRPVPIWVPVPSWPAPFLIPRFEWESVTQGDAREEEQVQRDADHWCSARAGGREPDGGGVPAARDQRVDLISLEGISLEGQVRWHGCVVVPIASIWRTMGTAFAANAPAAPVAAAPSALASARFARLSNTAIPAGRGGSGDGNV